MRNRWFVFLALISLSGLNGISTFGHAAVNAQEPLGIAKDSLQITALTRNFYRTNSKVWSWVPLFKFSTTRGVGSGDQAFVEYTIPGAGPLKFDCELNQRGNGFECGGRNIPDDKTSTHVGPVNFAIKLRNELQGTNSTLFTGRMKVAKANSNSGGPQAANEWVYYVDQDWNMPIGYIFYTPNKGVYEWDYPTFNVAFWVRGDLGRIEPHLFYQGKEIGRVFNDGIQMGAASCGAVVENLTTHNVNDSVPQKAKWSRVECDFPMVKGWDKAGANQSDMFKMAGNPGEYEVKILWRNKLSRSIKFTVGPDGKLENGIATANKLGSGRVIVPVTILGDNDGQWDKLAWKTEAFYGNPLTSFTPPQ